MWREFKGRHRRDAAAGTQKCILVWEQRVYFLFSPLCLLYDTVLRMQECERDARFLACLFAAFSHFFYIFASERLCCIINSMGKNRKYTRCAHTRCFCVPAASLLQGCKSIPSVTALKSLCIFRMAYNIESSLATNFIEYFPFNKVEMFKEILFMKFSRL